MNRWLVKFQSKVEYYIWKIKELEISDIEVYNKYIKTTKFPVNVWASNFVYLWVHTKSKKLSIFYGKIDEMLVTFVLTKKGRLYLPCLPYGRGDLLKVLIKCADFCYKWNIESNYTSMSTIIPINSHQLKYLKKLDKFTEHFKEEPLSGIERHCSISQLIDLKGKDFSGLRYKLNKFYRTYPNVTIRNYQPNDFSKVVKLGKYWEKTAGKNYKRLLDSFYFEDMLRDYEKLGLELIVVEDGKKIIGFTSGGVLPTGQAWGFLTKFMNNYQGISELLAIEMVKRIHKINPDAELINIGSDLGNKGLAISKEKYRPIYRYHRYALFFKYK